MLVTGVIAAVATLVLSNVFGYSSKAGYHLPGGSLTTKEWAVILKLTKIGVASAIAVGVAGTVLSMGPLGIGLILVGGVALVLYAEIDNWNFP